MKHKIVNLAVFKIAWTIVVVSAAAGTPFIGVVAVAAAVAIHLHTCDNVESETRLMLVAAVMGLAWESILVLSGLVSYSSGNLVPGIAPYWIVAMWVLFATTINAGMRWLQRNKVLAAVAGGIGGPMGFFAGAGVGAHGGVDHQSQRPRGRRRLSAAGGPGLVAHDHPETTAPGTFPGAVRAASRRGSARPRNRGRRP